MLPGFAGGLYRCARMTAWCRMVCCSPVKAPAPGIPALACRVFPLMFVSKNGGDVRLDPRAWALCPLMNSGIEGLRGDFMSAARETARLLMMDSACAAFIRAQEDYVKELTRAPWDDGGMA